MITAKREAVILKASLALRTVVSVLHSLLIHKLINARMQKGEITQQTASQASLALELKHNQWDWDEFLAF